MKVFFSLLLWASQTAFAGTAPYIPQTDAAVLETLPPRGGDAADDFRELRLALLQRPDDVKQASALADSYIKLGHKNADPRFYGYAHAVLQPWWQLAPEHTPAEILRLRAQVQAYNHQFAAALLDLEAAVQQGGRQDDLWWTMATTLQVMGRYEEAAQACQKINATGGRSSCTLTVKSLRGELKNAFATLQQEALFASLMPPGEAVWLYGSLGDMARRLGDLPAAQKAFTQALALEPQDLYARLGLLDVILEKQDFAAVIQNVPADTADLSLLLRLALACKKTAAKDYPQHLARIQQILEREDMRGAGRHHRELAWYHLYLLEDAKSALPLARASWQYQKEPIDAQLFLQAALQVDPAAASEVLTFLRREKVEDQRLASLLQKIDGAMQ